MADQEMRDKLRGEIEVAGAEALLPHQRRNALLIVVPEVDILDVAKAIAADEAEILDVLMADNKVYKPSLGELADWCVDPELQLQYVILQPYVLAQVVQSPKIELS